MTYQEYERTQIVEDVATKLDINPINKDLESVLTEIEIKCPEAAKIIRERKRLKDEIFNQNNSNLFEPSLDSNTGEVIDNPAQKQINDYAEKIINSKTDLNNAVKKCNCSEK